MISIIESGMLVPVLGVLAGIIIPLSVFIWLYYDCLLYTSPSPRDYAASRMPSSA